MVLDCASLGGADQLHQGCPKVREAENTEFILIFCYNFLLCIQLVALPYYDYGYADLSNQALYTFICTAFCEYVQII